MLVEAEALYLGEIEIAVLRGDIVGSEANDSTVFLVVESVEDNSSLPSTHDQLSLDGLEVPIDFGVSIASEYHFEFLQVIY